MKVYKKIVSMMLVSSLVMSTVAYAYTPQPIRDESVYINMDYYGGVETVSVVSTYKMNGASEIIDYGDYEEITNLTNYAEPTMKDNAVVWNLDENIDTFYYQGTLSEVELPWHISIEYKLNGVPIDATKIAGEKGVVEIGIKVIPNEKSHLYYQQNMPLVITAGFDREKVLNVESPQGDARVMDGEYSLMFIVLPGDEAEFTIRVGTESFEYDGITMMTMPLSGSEFSAITELQQEKETIESMAVAINNSLDILLGSMGGLGDSLLEVSRGLDSLKVAQAITVDSLEDISPQAVSVINQLEEMMFSIEDMGQSMDGAKELVQDIQEDTKGLGNQMDTLVEQMIELEEMMYELSDGTDGMFDMLEDVSDEMSKVLKRTDYMLLSISRLRESLDRLGDMRGLEEELGNMVTTIDGIIYILESIGGWVPPTVTSSTYQIDMTSDLTNSLKMMRNMIKEMQNMLRSMSYLMSDASYMMYELERMLEGLIDVVDVASKYDKEVDQVLEAIKDMLDMTPKMVTTVNELMQILIGVGDTVGGSLDGIVDMLEDMQTMLLDFSIMGQDTVGLARSLGDMMSKVGPPLDGGMTDTLNGIQGAIHDMQTSGEELDTLQESKDVIADIMATKWQDLTDIGIFEMNPDEPIVSFASPQNDAPGSLQIVMRTPEITLESVSSEPIDLEEQGDKGSIWDRIKDVFIIIKEMVVNFFSFLGK